MPQLWCGVHGIALILAAASCRVGVSAPSSEAPAPLAGRFERVEGALGREARALAVGHCDDDGALDVLLIGGDDTRVAPRALGIEPQMFLGRGDGTFAAGQTFAVRPRSYRAGLFVDLDGDGDDDVVLVGDDVGLLRNRGGCAFDPLERLASLDALQARGVSGVLATDANLDGVTDLALSLTGPTPRPYALLMGAGDGRFAARALDATPLDVTANGLVPFVAFFDDADGDGARDLFAAIDRQGGWFAWGDAAAGRLVRDDAVSARFSRADPMGVAPLDYDGDGTIDYFIAGVRGASLLLRGGTRALPDAARQAEVEGFDDLAAWGTWAFDADLDGTTDLLVLRFAESGAPTAPGTADLYLARGDGTFSEVGAARVDLHVYARAMACGDLSSAGDRACLVMASEGPVLLRDRITPRGRWAGIRLRGTVSAPDATGARVTLLGGPNRRAHYYGGQGPYAASHDPSLALGIGARDAVDVEVLWPSGIRQRVTALAAGRYTTVVEPAAVTLSARVAPADGVGLVEVVVDPASVGASRASVSITGAGTLVEAPPGPDGRLRWAVRAPATPGVAAITVTLDGTPLRLVPRVRFTGA